MRLTESKYTGRYGSICLFDGKWHDASGQTVFISSIDDRLITSDILHMESVNYESTGDVWLDGYQTVREIVEDYLGVDYDDGFVYFRQTVPSGNLVKKYDSRVKSPVSLDPEYAESMYMLAGINRISDLTDMRFQYLGSQSVVEIADLCGRTKFSKDAFRLLGQWCSDRDVLAIFMNCRACTSNALLNSSIGTTLCHENGFVDVFDFLELDRPSSSMNTYGDSKSARCLIRPAWFSSVSEETAMDVEDELRSSIYSLLEEFED